MRTLNRICVIAITIAALAITVLSLVGIKTMIAFTAWLVEPEAGNEITGVLGGL
jgi:hypothetical protein